MRRNILTFLLIGVPAALLALPVHAAELTTPDTGYLLNTFFLLVCGVLVMFMAAGFAMLEAGMVSSKSVAVICTKNVALYALAGIAFYLTGYQLMYGSGVTNLVGDVAVWSSNDGAALAGDTSSGHASAADWFFQMVFVATAASVVSGALAERIKFWPFALFVLVIAGFLYPVVGHWTWGGGWLAKIGFIDFAGSTIVHSFGGWAALTGIILLGPRRGRFDAEGRAKRIPPSSLPSVTLGTFILWLGWFGFNGGSQLSFSSIEDAVTVADIFVNTNAAAAGVVTVAVASQLIYRRLDLPLILNGALAGLVSITADPVTPTPAIAMLIGGAGGLVMMSACRLLEAFRLDDVVGVIPVHLAAGAWGTIAVAITNPEASIIVQGLGVVAIGLFVAITTFAVWFVLRAMVGIRLQRRQELTGGDLTEVGMRAYNLS